MQLRLDFNGKKDERMILITYEAVKKFMAEIKGR